MDGNRFEKPSRKPIRLDGYDYSRNGAYFVTICTKDRQYLFWEKYTVCCVGTAIGRPQSDRIIHLSEYGKYVREAFASINKHYPMVFTDKYVIMPNHIHEIIRIDDTVVLKNGGRPLAVPTISTVINQFKGFVSRKSGFHVWQGRFYDRILRNEYEYRSAWRYIEENPVKWEQDELFTNE